MNCTTCLIKKCEPPAIKLDVMMNNTKIIVEVDTKASATLINGIYSILNIQSIYRHMAICFYDVLESI